MAWGLVYVGACLLHYVGMASMMGVEIGMTPSQWAVIGALDSVLALVVVAVFLLLPMRPMAVVCGGVLLGSGVCILHYAGNVNMHFYPHSPPYHIAKSVASVSYLAVILTIQITLLAAFTLLQAIHMNASDALKARQRVEVVLSGAMPWPVARALTQGERPVYDHPSTAVVFVDMVGFSTLVTTLHLSSRDIVALLEEYFGTLDCVAACWGCTRVKTMGDGYLAVGALSFRPGSSDASGSGAVAVDVGGDESDAAVDSGFAGAALEAGGKPGVFMRSHIVRPRRTHSHSSVGVGGTAPPPPPPELTYRDGSGASGGALTTPQLQGDVDTTSCEELHVPTEVLAPSGPDAISEALQPSMRRLRSGRRHTSSRTSGMPPTPLHQGMATASDGRGSAGLQGVLCAAHMHIGAEAVGVPIRVGVNVGHLTSAVVGRARFAWDVWGPAVNVAARLESFAPPGSTAVTASVRQTLPPNVAALFDAAGAVALKGVGEVQVETMPARGCTPSSPTCSRPRAPTSPPRRRRWMRSPSCRATRR